MGVTEGSRNSVMFLGGGDNKEKKNKTKTTFCCCQCTTLFSDYNVQILNIYFQSFGKPMLLLMKICYNPLS